MGHGGGGAPEGLTQRTLKTLFLRAPYSDWAALAQGYKQEFRASRIGAISTSFQVPTPVVLYAVSSGGHRRQKLMVLAEYREERLIDISDNPSSLAREGFVDYDGFKRYWRTRTHRPYRALDVVGVFRLALWSPLRRETLGRLLLDRLYGDFLRPQ